jgi:hypothetical protein
MRLKQFALTLIACLAIVGTCAASASATATLGEGRWFVGSTKSPVSELIIPQKLTASLGENPVVGEKFVIEILLSGGVVVKLEMSKVECSNCTITNGGGATATGVGKLIFSGGGIGPPWRCPLKGGKIETKTLAFEARYMEGEKWLMKVGPTSGEFDFEIQPLEGCTFTSIPVKGATFSEFQAKTGTFANAQTAVFSPAISAAAGSSWQAGVWTVQTTGTFVLKTEGKPYFGVE